MSLINMLENLCERTLVPRVIILALILLKVVRVFINRIIRQMHEEIIQVAADRGHIL